MFLVRINKRVIGDYLGEREASSERLGRKPCPVCHVQFLLFSSVIVLLFIQFTFYCVQSVINSVTVCNHSLFETVSPENSVINLFIFCKFFQSIPVLSDTHSEKRGKRTMVTFNPSLLPFKTTSR